ncbi:hypothetical protein GJ496_002304 [Pomphorhynchus laevis]|nr:hypothetical protein GJ496_002304 [Pomphorhynchus laevis]
MNANINMEAEVPRPQVNIQEQMHYLELQKLTNSLCLASLEDEKYDVLRKLRFYTLTSDRIRTAAYQQQLPHLLLDEFIGTELSDKSKLINEYIQILASLALASTSSSGLPKLSKWEEACKKTISALKLNVNFYGIACAQFITNLIVRLTCGLERERISTFTLQIEAAFLSPRRGSDPTRSGPPLLDVECLKLFFTLINNQDGPTLETVCHLMFRLFTVAYDDRQQGDKCGFDRCTPILFIERKAMRELFSGQERRTIIMKQLSSFLQSELNVNNIVLSLHILSLIFSLIPRVEIREYLYHKLSTPTKIDIKDYFDSRVEGESPKDIVARIREANRKRFDDNHELTDIVLLDHLFMLTKSVQKSIIQLLSAMALCICMLRSRVISPVREIRASRLLIPCLCRLACVLCTEGDSEDVFNIPTMAMVLLLKIVPRHPRLEQVACYCDNLPKRLMEYLQSPRKKPANETDAESQEWSVIGGRCVFRTPISYDMQQWSRFFLCFDPCDHMILYAMPAIPLKRPWLDDRSFRSIVFQCIAALCSRLDRSRKRFLCDDRLLDLAIDAINSSFPPLKLSALLCYHVLSRSKVFSTLTKTLRKAAASEIELRRVYSMQPSSNPPPLDGRDRTGGCPVTLPESDLPYDDEDSSSEDSEQMRITQAVPIGTDMNTMLIRVTLSILANISAGMSPGCPRTFTEVVNNSETNEQIVRCVIQPTTMAASGTKFTNVLRAKEDLQKTPQQLEHEKKEVLKSRIVPLDISGKSKSDLIQLAKKLHHVLTNLQSQIYDLTERYERQKYDMTELTERARQIEKGKTKTRKSNVVHTGLGGSVFPWLTDKFSSAPAKVSLFSRYERVTDRRTFDERRIAFLRSKLEDKPLLSEKPKAKIRQVETAEPEPTIERRRSSARTKQPSPEPEQHPLEEIDERGESADEHGYENESD